MSSALFPLYAHRVNKFIDEYPDLQYNGSEVVCVVCNKKLLCWKRSMCNAHVNSTGHKRKVRGENLYIEFMCNLIFMLSACNVSFNVVQKQPFRQFWKKYIPQWKLPSSETLRQYLPQVRRGLDSISQPYLLACKRLQQCSGDTITELVKSTLEQFEISNGQVLMFVSDDVAYMIRAGHLLKSVYPHLIHITCIIRTLHLVEDTIRKCYPQVDQLIAETKAVFTKSPKRIREFHNLCTGIPEPPQPILTRWGTWLNAVFYYVQNFEAIKTVVFQFNSKEAECIKKSQQQFQNEQVYADLQTIRKNYTAIVIRDAIRQFQNTSLSLMESLHIIDQLKTQLQTVGDKIGVIVKEKFETLLRKNPDLDRLRNIYTNSVPEDPLTEFKEHFAYASLTSLDIERSFSLYKNIFTPRRTKLQEKTVETHLMLQMFNYASEGKPELPSEQNL
ncbi:hypothetical protein NQ318_016308 [Aromia moschata]|uniref:DUF659 domain-containing protein n=1 Tax=Aromia moschata TaxID=1265417 RepID=A0AAV8Z3D6_9CUCU|nr:hypothetical protein NQ318_016308 [Aromia moschata]